MPTTPVPAPVTLDLSGWRDAAEQMLADYALSPRLALAGQRFLAAATTWALATTSCIVLGIDITGVGDDAAIEAARIDMLCARAVFAWELQHTPMTPPIGAHYDDPTIDELLRTAQA